MDHEAITIMVRGLSIKEILEKLGGIGIDKPVRAISVGDVFAERDNYKKYADFCEDYACPNCQALFLEIQEMENQGDLE
jgi:hypothetical protein